MTACVIRLFFFQFVSVSICKHATLGCFSKEDSVWTEAVDQGGSQGAMKHGL